MSTPAKQIGWSTESNLLWEISRTLDFIYGNVGGLQGAITLTTTGNSGPATFINNVLNVPEYTLEGLGGVPLTRTITINGDTQTLANDVNFTVLGTSVSIVPNYSALPAPATVPQAFYWVENSQGTYWLPGSMGGTFYNAGLYYSNGVRWEFMETPWQATQAEVDAGVNFSKFVTPLTFEAAAKWFTKTEWKGTWQQQQYLLHQQVIDEGYLAIANKTTSERPSPQKVGEPFNIYQGTIGSTTAVAKQVIFGNKYTFLENVFFEGWRINVVAGNRYTVYLVRDPDGANVISQIIQFIAQSSGWVNLSAQSLLINAGNTYAVIAAVTEPTVAPVTFNGNWNISQPQNITVPTSGQITQPRSNPGLLYINNLDSASANRSTELAGLNIGDVIKTGTNTWAIQSKSAQAGYFIFGVSPALLNVNIGVQNFIFEETSSATLTYPLDVNYWALHPSTIATIKGLLGIDVPFSGIVPDDTAYGIGVLLQTMVISADWDIQAYSGVGGGGGGGASALDDLTDVEILTPTDGQLLTYEAASSLWKNKPAPVSGVPLSRTLTINGVTFDLSANRIWNVGDVLTTGSYANPPWITSLAWSKITGTPTTLAGYGITDAVSATRTININGNALDLSANREWRVAQADTGVLTFAGLTPNSTTSINIGAATGYVINNESTPASPTYTFINYPGVTGITVPTRLSGPATYVLIQPDGLGGGTPVFQNTIPTSAQRKTGMWLGKASHPTGGLITVVLNEPDYILSPQAFARDLFQALGPYINENVYPSPAGANLNVSIAAGNIYGDGINFVNDRTNPNKLLFPAVNPVTLAYRTNTGVAIANQTVVDNGFYDVAGVRTAVPGGPNVSTLQYFWVVTGATGAVIVQYGQTLYNNLDAAKAAVGKESNLIFANLPGNAILIAVLAVSKGATVLNDLTQAQFFKADKLGQIGAAGGGSTTGAGPVTITITSATSITTATTDASGYGQDGRNVVVDNSASAINITCNGGVTATYAKLGTGAVTFVAGAGRTLILVDSTALLNGAIGSTAALWPVGTADFLRISNA